MNLAMASWVAGEKKEAKQFDDQTFANRPCLSSMCWAPGPEPLWVSFFKRVSQLSLGWEVMQTDGPEELTVLYDDL